MNLPVECPSGLKGEVRGLKVKEFKLFADAKKMRSGHAYDEVLAACWKTTELGPAYPKGLDWSSNALQGDAFKVLLDIRRASHFDMDGGGELSLDFPVKCGGCHESTKASVWLCDLTSQKYPAESIRKHLAGELFELRAGGKLITFKLVTRDNEKAMQKLMQGDEDPLVATIAYRLMNVEGVGDEKHLIRRWVDDLDVSELQVLREGMDKVGGGVDSTVEVHCRQLGCGHVTEVEIPFGGRDFWTPKKRGTPRNPKTADSQTAS